MFFVKQRGFNLIDPEVATKSLLVKWIVKAFEGGKTNLHILIQYRLEGHALIEKTNGALNWNGCFLTITFQHMDPMCGSGLGKPKDLS